MWVCVDGLLVVEVTNEVGLLMADSKFIGEEGPLAVVEVVSVKGVEYGAEEEGKKSRKDCCRSNAGCNLINRSCTS